MQSKKLFLGFSLYVNLVIRSCNTNNNNFKEKKIQYTENTWAIISLECIILESIPGSIMFSRPELG